MPTLGPVIDARLYDVTSGVPHTWDVYYAHALGSGAPVNAASAISAGESNISVINYASSIEASELSRAAFIFNTSAISTRPENATFKLHGRSTSTNDVVCVKATFANNSSIVVGDYDAWDEENPTIYTNTILANNYNTAGYNNFTLSSAALDDMRDLNYLKMMCMSEIDATYIGDGGDTDDDPTDDSTAITGYYGSTAAASGKRPYIIYDGYSHAVSGTDGSDISEINGVPVISISDIDGVGI